MLRVDGVTKHFGSTHALGPISLGVAAGSTVALIGPSGCGKSTLLRIVLGLVWPENGNVRVDGVPLSPSYLCSIRQHIGYVIQEGGLFPHLSARANVTLMARHLGWSAERQSARVDELCATARFPTELLGRYPGQLSGGQRQRVSLMRSLVLDPRLLLLDEPLGALDPMIRFELQRDLKRIFRALGKTVVLVTHDLAEAAYFADEVVLMRSGKIVQRGTAAELIDAPADGFVRRFIRAQRHPIRGDAHPAS